jgi:nucleotide-binding universal stress UspA family protein
MGSHSESRNALARRLLGTVATAVVGDAPVPVTVIR